MKLFTLNTHSLVEDKYYEKLDIFVDFLSDALPDIIVLQEIMQPINNDKSDYFYCNLGKIPLREGNHALNIQRRLNNMGIKYNLIWLGIKKSYDIFEEGLAILTKNEIEAAEEIILSPYDDYDNWKTRKAIGVKIKNEWYYNVHLGWWNDKSSPFEIEAEKLIFAIKDKKDAWILGDFNSRADENGKGYDMLLERGLYDTYDMAKIKDDGITAYTDIDGWGSSEKKGIRIDYIFTNKKRKIKSIEIVFNGINRKRISDHNGILLITESKEEK